MCVFSFRFVIFIYRLSQAIGCGSWKSIAFVGLSEGPYLVQV